MAPALFIPSIGDGFLLSGGGVDLPNRTGVHNILLIDCPYLVCLNRDDIQSLTVQRKEFHFVSFAGTVHVNDHPYVTRF